MSPADKEPIGSVAEEAAKLFAVLQQASGTRTTPSEEAADARTAPGANVGGPETASGADEGAAGTAPGGAGPASGGAVGDGHRLGPDCVWCPVCQVIHRVRNASPETIEQLSAAAAHVLGSVRSLLEAAADAARQAREDAASRSTPQQEEEPVRSRVDRIDVSEDPEPWD